MSRDFRDLSAAFNARGVEFLVVSAYALAAHGFVCHEGRGGLGPPDPANGKRVLAALADFGAPLHDLTVEDLSQPGLIFQIGVDPIRIDVITSIDGVTFSDGWAQRVSARFADQEVPVLSREHLLANKRASGREQDLVDVKWLEKNAPKKPDGGA